MDADRDELASQLLSTNWTALAAGDVAHVVRAYWKPVFRYLRTRLPDEATAEDVTQEFFLRFLDTDAVSRADRQKGRFRTFLFHSARQFLVDQYRRRSAARRGGQVAKVPVDEVLDLQAAGDEPQEAFDRQWFTSLLNRARKEVKRHYAERGTPQMYQAFHLYYYGSGGESGTWSHRRIAEALAVPVTQVNNWLHRARVLFAERIREAVGGYARTEEEALEEMRAVARFLEGHVYGGTPASTLGLPPPESEDE